MELVSSWDQMGEQGAAATRCTNPHQKNGAARVPNSGQQQQQQGATVGRSNARHQAAAVGRGSREQQHRWAPAAAAAVAHGNAYMGKEQQQ